MVTSISTLGAKDIELGHHETGGKHFDYSQRAQSLRAIVLGGNKGLVSTTLLVMGVGIVVHESKALVLAGLVGLVAGAFSVYTQVDIINCQTKRDLKMGRGGLVGQASIPSPTQIAVAASLAYLVGGTMPLLVVGYITNRKLRFYGAMVSACVFMLVFGMIGASLGKTPILRSCARILVGGCIEIMIMLGKRKVLESYGF